MPCDTFYDAVKKVIFRCPFNITRYQSTIWLQFNTGFRIALSHFLGHRCQQQRTARRTSLKKKKKKKKRKKWTEKIDVILMPIITLFLTIQINFFHQSAVLHRFIFSAGDIISPNVRIWICYGMMASSYLYQL